MSELDRHIEKPDMGVITTDLFIYDAADPGTGALVAVVLPHVLDDRPVKFADTPELEVTFLLDRSGNTAEIAFVHKGDPPSIEYRAFRLVPEFQTVEKCSLTVLISDWKIVALIDGEPLKRLV